jgi:hypothetical protein
MNSRKGTKHKHAPDAIRIFQSAYHNVVKRLIMTGLLFLFMQILYSQENEVERLYWSRDSVLQLRLDTTEREKVVADTREGIKRAVNYCKGKEAFLRGDSVDAWLVWMRWAVILEDKKSLELIDDLVPLAQQKDRGNWQYYFVQMTMRAAYEEQTKNQTPEQKTDNILSHLNKGNANEQRFYRERMMDLGPESFPAILEWSRLNIIPRMLELDREMLSEEDLQFTLVYNDFIIALSTMISSEQEAQWIRQWLKDADPNMQRFARDLLAASGIE